VEREKTTRGADATPLASVWICPECRHELTVQPGPSADHLETCAICGNHEFYKKKDFPHWLGLTILTTACLAFIGFHAFYWNWVAWSILIGSALVDGIMYLTVKDVIVCYRCEAQYRGLSRDTNHQPFELGIHERYRQERIRREQLKNTH
jgi:hypothetical protein